MELFIAKNDFLFAPQCGVLPRRHPDAVEISRAAPAKNLLHLIRVSALEISRRGRDENERCDNGRMGHKWIDEGLRQAVDRAEQEALAAERERHRAAVVGHHAPDLMLRLVSAIGAVVEEYKEKARVGSDEIEFEPLPRESFRVTKVTFPSVNLECHPDYEGHVVYCNLARTESHESGARELEFALEITADDLDTLAFRDDKRSFATVDEAAEFLLKPVLFPSLQQF